MPHFVVDKIQNALNDHTKPLKGSRIHIVGVAYKRDIDDMRESPALDVMLLLKQRGAKLTFTDPYVPTLKIDGVDMQSEDLMVSVPAADCTVVITDHSNIDYKTIVNCAKLIVDTRNALKKFDSDKIVRL